MLECNTTKQILTYAYVITSFHDIINILSSTLESDLPQWCGLVSWFGFSKEPHEFVGSSKEKI